MEILTWKDEVKTPMDEPNTNDYDKPQPSEAERAKMTRKYGDLDAMDDDIPF
jgi:hypothetical protein